MINNSFVRYSWTPASLDRPSFHYRPHAEETYPPLVSIITPVFNPGSYFLETALSLLRQSYQYSEWVIVDDASTDHHALTNVMNLVAADQRVRLITLPHNSGPSAARNAGVREATGSLLFLIDCDDLIEPTAIEKYLWTMYSFPEVGFVSSYQVGFGTNEYLNTNGFHEPQRFLLENATDSMAMIRRIVFESIGGFDETNRDGLEDWEFWIRAAENGFWGYTIPEFLEWYRWKGVPTKRWPNWDGSVQQATFREKLRQQYPRIFAGEFPTIQVDRTPGHAYNREPVSLHNRLEKVSQRVLIVSDSFQDSEKRVVEMVGELQTKSIEVSVVALVGEHDALSEQAQAQISAWTPDLFALDRFLPSSRTLQFLVYLHQSRQFDSIVIVATALRHNAQLLAREFGCVPIVAEQHESAHDLTRRIELELEVEQ